MTHLGPGCGGECQVVLALLSDELAPYRSAGVQ